MRKRKRKIKRLREDDKVGDLLSTLSCRHQALCQEIQYGVYKILTMFIILQRVGVSEKTDESKSKKKEKTNVFDLSVWRKKEWTKGRDFDDELEDCFVGIELEEKPYDRYYDLQKIDKEFGYSPTLKEIFLYDFKRGSCIKFSRWKKDVITRYENCWKSEIMGVDIKYYAKKSSSHKKKSSRGRVIKGNF